MIIYNVTSNIEKNVHDKWLIWIKEHIQQVLSTGCFLDAKLTKVLVEDDQGAATYAVQYRSKSREELERYYSTHADAFRKDALHQFGDQVLSFRTELEIIEEYSVKID